MTQTTKTTCDQCGVECSGKHCSMYGTMVTPTKHYCEHCTELITKYLGDPTAMEFATLRQILARVTSERDALQVANAGAEKRATDAKQALACTEANYQDMRKALGAAQDRLGEVERARVTGLRGSSLREQVNLLSADLDAARTDARRLREFVGELVNMLGKKRRRRNSERIREIAEEAALSACRDGASLDQVRSWVETDGEVSP